METATEGATLSATQAAEELARLEGLHGALERRTSGITWFVWALAVPGIFVTYNLLAARLDNDIPPLVAAIAWAPWVAVGTLTSALLWRSVELVVPVKTQRKEIWIGMAVFIIGVPLGTFLAAALGATWTEPAIALAVVGAASVVVGSIGVFCTGPTDRRLWIASGSVMLLVALVGSLALSGRTDAAYQAFGYLAPATFMLLATGNGLYMSLRG